jgi:NAD(P)-dependent dehydrogenase (short-subunit alcohol dehydrogenase family)
VIATSILVNNAGLQKDATFQDMTLENWNFVLGVNLTGQILFSREAIREFWAGHANYVNGTSLFVDGGMTLYPGFTTNG